jgi:hypothetical protein
MDHIRQTAETFIAKVEQLERELLEHKKMVNMLLKTLGEPERYNLEPEPEAAVPVHGNWRSDEFYGQPLAAVVRKILLARKAVNLGAAPVNDIYAAMKEGGFDFGSQDDESAKHGLRASLRKNTFAFHRLPNGNYGLKEWYPAAKERKSNGASEVKEEDDGVQSAKAAKAPPKRAVMSDDGIITLGDEGHENKERGHALRNGKPEPGDPIPF